MKWIQMVRTIKIYFRKPNRQLHHPLFLKLICICLSTGIIAMLDAQALATEQQDILIKKRNIFEKHISSIADSYIGLPFKMGGDPDKDKSTDNSHLICAIYRNAAKKAGLSFKGYMAMKELLQNTHKVDISRMTNGDLMVLNSGLAALVFGYDGKSNYHLLYVSGKHQKVVAVTKQEAIYKGYWGKNLKGVFRIDDELLK